MNKLSYKSIGAYVVLFIGADISLDYILKVPLRVTRVSLAITLLLIVFAIATQVNTHLSSKNK